MAFTGQFSTGKNSFDEADRLKIISSRYINVSLFSADNNFVMGTNYIFFDQFVTELHHAISSISIQLQKGKVFSKD